jgi:hypothetical protein
MEVHDDCWWRQASFSFPLSPSHSDTRNSTGSYELQTDGQVDQTTKRGNQGFGSQIKYIKWLKLPNK